MDTLSGTKDIDILEAEHAQELKMGNL